MVRNIAQEALESTEEQFQLPKKSRDKLFNYQVSAVQIAAHHLNKRGVGSVSATTAPLATSPQLGV